MAKCTGSDLRSPTAGVRERAHFRSPFISNFSKFQYSGTLSSLRCGSLLDGASFPTRTSCRRMQSILKTIPDRGAVTAWSPLANAPNMLTTGTREGGGGGFDERGGELTLYAIDLSSFSQDCRIIGRCALRVRARARARALLRLFANPSSHSLAQHKDADALHVSRVGSRLGRGFRKVQFGAPRWRYVRR